MTTIQSLPSVVLPGDDVTYIRQISATTSESQKEKPIKLGDGLIYDAKSDKIKATLAGKLIYKSATNTYFVLTNSKRYIPRLNDRILGIVEERTMGDYYRVTIPSSSTGSALLLSTAFNGATKRNKPNLKTGDLLYARISSCNIHVMEPEISCECLPGEIAKGQGSKKDWMTDESTYGVLKGGSCIQVSLGLAQELLKPSSVVLDALADAKIPFEICIGVNGFIWVNASSPEYTILILNAIQNSQVMTEEQVRGMVKSLIQTVRSMMNH